MPPPEVFFSYAHTDEPLLLELRKHLAALERARLIQGWFDRKIEPGSEWAAEIQAAMERATIILLLISADFIASEYCATIELPFALERHKAGALVIPVLLRPVAWEDLAVSALQALPTGARPVTAWPNSDEAFRDIAEHLREMILTRRLKNAPKSPAPAVDSVSADRVLDAAVPSSVEWNEPSQLVAMIRCVGSAGLKAVLQVNTMFAAKPEDVQSKTFEVEFPLDAAGRTLPAALELVLESPGCEPPQNRKKVRVPPSGDSDICVFLFTPKKTGQLMFNLEVRYQDVEVGSQFLVSEATEALPGTPAPAPYSLASLPLTSTTFFYGMRAMAAAAGAPAVAAPVGFVRLPQMPPAPAAAASPPPGPSRLVMMPPPAKVVLGQGRRPGLDAMEQLGKQRAAATSRSWLTKPMMTFASAAAVVVVAGLTLISYRTADTTSVAPRAPARVSANPSPSPSVVPGPSAPADSAVPPPPPPVETGPAAPGNSLPAAGEAAARPSPPAPAPGAVQAVPALHLALAAVARKDYGSAADNLTIAIGQQPDNAELYWRRSEAYRALGKPELAMLDVEEALTLNPNDPYAHLVKGELLRDEALRAKAAEAPAIHAEALAEYRTAQAAPELSAANRQFVGRRIKVASKAAGTKSKIAP